VVDRQVPQRMGLRWLAWLSVVAAVGVALANRRKTA
jgi:hypothetical protein